jgi:hypothetical protein
MISIDYGVVHIDGGWMAIGAGLRIGSAPLQQP